MAKQHSGVSAQATVVNDFGNLQPAFAADFLRTDFIADLFPENLGATPRHGAQTRLLERTYNIDHRFAADSRKIIDFNSSECFDVQARGFFFDGPQHFQIKLERQIRMQATDRMNLGGAGSFGFTNLGPHLIQIEGVTTRIACFSGKSTEDTLVDTEVGIIDVAVDVEINLIAVFSFIALGCQFTNLKQFKRFKQF